MKLERREEGLRGPADGLAESVRDPTIEGHAETLERKRRLRAVADEAFVFIFACGNDDFDTQSAASKRSAT